MMHHTGKTPPYIIPELENCLAQFFSDGEVLFAETTSSTNAWGMRLPLPDTPPKTPKVYLIVADKQTAGRGRMGRSWSSPASGDIYMTLVLSAAFPFESAGLVPLAMGLAAQRAVQVFLSQKVSLKWPNDLICADRKLAGILCEARLAPDYVQSYVIGLGLNVMRESFPTELVDTATSLQLLEPHRQWERTSLVMSILEEFFKLWPMCLTRNAALINAYTAACMNIGQKVYAQGSDGEMFEGVAETISEDGALMVRRADGTLTVVHSGEVLVLP